MWNYELELNIDKYLLDGLYWKCCIFVILVIRCGILIVFGYLSFVGFNLFNLLKNVLLIRDESDFWL